ncbi:MAG: hypothetical protein AB7I27_03600 [Bacteriovoracaceae bacterium]
MKINLLIFFLCASFSLGAQEPQDIVFKSRFDDESSSAFIKRLRDFFISNKFGDPYKQVINRPISVDLSKVLDDIPEDTQVWIRELQSILKLKLFDSEIKLIFEDLGYSINQFLPTFNLSSSENNRVEYVTSNRVNGITLNAKKISFEVTLKKASLDQVISFQVQFINPEFVVQEDLLLEVPMGWSSSLRNQDLLLSLNSVDLRKVFSEAGKRPELISFRVQDFHMPDVAFRVGNKEIKFDPIKIENFFTSRQEQFKKGILDIINQRMQNRLDNVLSDNPETLPLPRTKLISGPINGVFDVTQLNANKTGILQINLDGHFCSSILEGDQFCRDSKIPAKMIRAIDEATFDRSMREINRFLIEKSANIAVSVSEHYLNQLIQSTIQAGLWEKTLDEKGFKLGSETAFVLADERGDTFSLYLDVIYQLSRSQRILVGRSSLRFPVKFKIALKIEDQDGLPHLLITVKKVVTDRDLIFNGVPEYNLPSNVGNARFRERVLGAILYNISSFQGSELIHLEVLDFKNSYLEKLQFFSDGMGRATAIINFED